MEIVQIRGKEEIIAKDRGEQAEATLEAGSMVKTEVKEQVLKDEMLVLENNTKAKTDTMEQVLHETEENVHIDTSEEVQFNTKLKLQDKNLELYLYLNYIVLIIYSKFKGIQSTC